MAGRPDDLGSYVTTVKRDTATWVTEQAFSDG